MNEAKFTLTATILAAAFGLALGLMSAPAAAHNCVNHDRPNHRHCPGDDDTGGLANLTLTGAMSTAGLEVGVSQNTAKRLQFGNHNFGNPPILVHLGLDLFEFGPGQLADECHVHRDGLGSEVGPSNLALQEELNTAVIDDGDLTVRIDKKKHEAQFNIEYLLTNMADPLEGRVRILFINFASDGMPNLVDGDTDFPGTDLTIIGDIAIWWSDLSGLNEDRILVCDTNMVDVVLSEIP